MSSFRRKGLVKQSPVYPGTRPSPAKPSTLITSTGIPSLDDILGGGLPLSCSLLVAAPDLHSSYGDLVQKYFIAQGLSCRHRLCVIDDNAEAFVKDIMWIPRARNGAVPQPTVDEDEEKFGSQEDQKIKIAWRYEQMKPFQTTVAAPSSSSVDEYCVNFDLSSRVPSSTIEANVRSGQLAYIGTEPCNTRTSTSEVLSRIADFLKPTSSEAPPNGTPVRICIPSLGSPQWGELMQQDILHFLHSLRSLLRQHPHACASVRIAPHLSTDSWGGSGWLQKLGWVTDSAFTLSAFSADPALTATFPNHHGLLHIHALPAPHTILPPSDKFSTLRGLSASAGGTRGSGENNITFKSTRKRLIFETLHLDIEGGVGERRTSATTHETFGDAHDHKDHTGHTHQDQRATKTAFAAIEVAVEASRVQTAAIDGVDKATDEMEAEVKPKKQKKKVAFRADRPDLYDF